MSVINIDFAHEVVRDCLEKAGLYSEIFCQRRTVMQMRLEDRELDDVSFGIDSGAGIRVIKGDLVAYAHTDVLTEESIRLAAETAVDALAGSKGNGRYNISLVRRSAPETVGDADGGDHDVARVKEQLFLCDDTARSMGSEIRQVTALHNGVIDEDLLVNSLGEVRETGCIRTRLIVQVVAESNGVIQMGMEAPGLLAGGEFYSTVNSGEVARTAAIRAITMLDAAASPAGRMPVVINSGTGGVLLHEACGHGLEADHVQKRASVYAGKMGDMVAAAGVSVIDNPTLKGLWGSYRYDDEGTPAQETVLINKGQLTDYLYSKFNAMRDNVPSTGNGRRESFRNAPVPRMTNTYLKPGDADPREILSSTPKGLYARKMGGGQVDPTTGDFVFSVSEGYLIEGGKLGKPVRGAVLIGNGPRTLEMIDAVGDDLSFEEGTCGKEGQGVPVCTGGPTFRVSELTVGGVEI